MQEERSQVDNGMSAELGTVHCPKCGDTLIVWSSKNVELNGIETTRRVRVCRKIGCGTIVRTAEVPLAVALDLWEVDE